MSSRPATARPKPGAQLELGVDDCAFGGAGVARVEGYVVFVRGAVPGDRGVARITRYKRDYAEAGLATTRQSAVSGGPSLYDGRGRSPERTTDVAPHPGAPWGVPPYERQL